MAYVATGEGIKLEGSHKMIVNREEKWRLPGAIPPRCMQADSMGQLPHRWRCKEIHEKFCQIQIRKEMCQLCNTQWSIIGKSRVDQIAPTGPNQRLRVLWSIASEGRT